MLLAALVLLAFHQGACPSAFSSSTTTISALSNSQVLSVCVADSVLVHGTNGGLTLVLGSNSSAPRCLVYPNGLSPDLTLNLLQTGHLSCWSLYPPSQPISIVNVGTPSATKIHSALKAFRPDIPVIYVSPKSGFITDLKLSFSSSAHTQLIKGSLLNLPIRVRFTPKAFSWVVGNLSSKISKPSYIPRSTGLLSVTLTVEFMVEYQFPGLTSWIRVSPNILANAIPLRIQVGDKVSEVKAGTKPRLVLRPCYLHSWGC